MMDVATDVDTHGPLFSGALERAVARGCEDARQEIGAEGVDMVRSRFDQVLRHDSWHYRSGRRTPGRLRASVQAVPDGERIRINNGTPVYRFWIEGVGKRNLSTRFKGYFTFRLVRLMMRAAAPPIVRRHVSAAVRRAR